MKSFVDTDYLRNSTAKEIDPNLDRAFRLAAEVKKQWRNGVPPDARSFLSENPDLLRFRSVALDLAAEEFSRRQVRGEAMSADEFALRFPGMEKSLYFLLEVRQMIQVDADQQLDGDSLDWPEVGQVFLGFALVAELGQGTFGRVFLASEPSLGNRLVALKISPQGEWEAELLGKLRHQNIVPVYSIRTDSRTGLTAICMPYLGKLTLRDAIDLIFSRQPQPRKAEIFREIILEASGNTEIESLRDFDSLLVAGSYQDAIFHLACQLAQALSFTHRQGIFHRDLKPSNILLSDEGRPLILDFNLSSDISFTPSRLGGTLPYMAPEQIKSFLSDPSQSFASDSTAADLFSLGIILYELCTGELPYGPIAMKGSWDDVALNILTRHRNGLRPLREVNPDIDRGLASLIEQCLASDPLLRPVSAESFAESLKRQTKWRFRAVRWAKKHKSWIGFCGLLFVACGIILGSYFISRDPYHVRAYREGISLQQDNPSAAIEKFTAALDGDSSNPRIHIERGKTYYLQGKLPQALDDFQAAYALVPDGENQAYIGHCLCRMKSYNAAIMNFEEALSKGHQSAALWNNLGYSKIKIARFADADNCFQKADILQPNYSTIWSNRLALSINRYDRKGLSEADALAFIKALDDIKNPSPDLFFFAALLESRMHKTDPRISAAIYEHLRKAIALGADPRRIVEDIGFKQFRDEKEFMALARLSPGSKKANSSENVMSPF
jgi:serine/threonine protein kinase